MFMYKLYWKRYKGTKSHIKKLTEKLKGPEFYKVSHAKRDWLENESEGELFENETKYHEAMEAFGKKVKIVIYKAMQISMNYILDNFVNNFNDSKIVP